MKKLGRKKNARSRVMRILSIVCEVLGTTTLAQQKKEARIFVEPDISE